MDKRNYPLNQAKEIQLMLKEFRMLASLFSYRIKLIESENLVYLVDIEYDGFFFRVFKPNLNSNDVPFFHFESMPQNSVNFDKQILNSTSEIVLQHFDNWINILNEYHEVNFLAEDYFTKKYEDEFYAEFEIMDDDSSINPFENNQQIYLYNFLEYVSKELRNLNSDDQILLEIISDTDELKDNIQNLTKMNVIRKMSLIFARIKKFSLKLSMDIFDVAKKEIIKKCLYGGFDELHHLIDKF
ncbi:MAG: hypothetical protein LDL38_12485 [Flavobacterium piscis]|nr:hypothetical protein [Flavobacterium piscis]